jgi:hypothetical protein
MVTSATTDGALGLVLGWLGGSGLGSFAGLLGCSCCLGGAVALGLDRGLCGLGVLGQLLGGCRHV